MCATVAALLATGAQGRVLTPARTQQLFHTPYRQEDSRHFDIEASSTFQADARRRFDLSYADGSELKGFNACLLYTSPSPRDQRGSRMPSSA